MKLRVKPSSRFRNSACTVLFSLLTTAAVASGFPVGSYISESYTLKFEPNGSFVVTKGSDVALVEGLYRVKGDHLQITDKRGPMACKGKALATGKYTWSDDTGVLKLTCSIPCDHIPRRSWPLFRARDLLRGVIESFQREQMQ